MLRSSAAFVRCFRCLARGMRRLAAGPLGLHLIPAAHTEQTTRDGARNRVIGRYNLPDSLVLGPRSGNTTAARLSHHVGPPQPPGPRGQNIEAARFPTIRENLTSLVARCCPGKTDAEARLTQS